jgi:large subunit ribosomal protein L32e
MIMAEVKKLLQVRKTIKARKPEFIQQDYHKKRRLSRKWNRPTGLQSKMRHQFKGYSRRVKQGWRSPVEIRGFHQAGLLPIMIHTLKELENVKAHQGIIIAANVGSKKKLLIMDKAVQLNIMILNIKPEQYKKGLEVKKAKKAEDKKSKEEQKKKSLEDSMKKAEKAKKDKEKVDKSEAKSEEEKETAEEEKKIEEKKEKDDVLIHRAP